MASDLSLEEIKNEHVDLENIPIEEVFKQLKCSREGLSEEEGAKRLQIFGPNKLEEKKESKLLKFLGFMWNPLSWVMECAAVMAIVLANGGGKPPDWQDFVGIAVLLIINSTVSFIEENNAGNAAAALMAGLAPKTKVLRDGKWTEQDAAILVPGDLISVKLGDIIPADARLLEGDALKIDQSALTGESLPVTKNPGDEVFSGSTCKQGEIEAVVIATGVHTFFGKAAHLVDSTNHVGHFQKVLTAIGNFCICSIGLGMVIEIVVMYPVQHRKYREGIDNLLVLLIGGIPIAMPTVLSVTMAIGSHRLSEQGAITKRMTAIEEMAGMDVLCSDKTGTLTLNKLTVDKQMIEVFPKNMDKDSVVLYAARASRTENQDAIDASIVNMLSDPKEARAGITELHFLPFNPVEKRTAITYIDSNGDWHRSSKGAPEQIIDLCELKGEVRKKAHDIIDNFANRGLRSLGVARQAVPEKNKESAGGPWEFIGLLPLFDPPRHDSAETIKKALDLGVNVKMITGDQLAIGKETGRRLGMGTNMYPSSSLLGQSKDESIASIPIDELIEKADGFAGVFPEHKYEIVKKLQERKHICGMTGDGVNDAPALKKADIGIAVADATDAARSASDIVLTEPGLSVIVSIPIAMPTVLSVTMAIGSHRLSEQGAITKRMTAIEEMAGMDVLCSDKTGTLTLNKLTVDKQMIEVFPKNMDKDSVVLYAARASRTENQDAIDASIVNMLSDPKEARAGITELHFLPFNPVEKRTAITYIDSNGDWHRSSKGAPEQIIDLCELKGEVRKKAHDIIDNFANRGLRSLGVARQAVPEKNKESAGGPWEFIGLLPLFDPPRHDSAETIKKALDLGVNVKMITGDQLAIGKETGRRLGMGTNMYPSSSLLGQSKDESIASIPIDELIEKADGFAGVFPEHKYEIVKKLQERKHICGMTGDGVNDAPALKKADIGIAVADATDAARSASDIVLTEPGLSVIVSAVLTSRAIFQRMKNYTIYAVSITIRIVLGFLLIALIWKFDFSPFMVLIMAILNDGTIMTISKDRVKPSPVPDSWKLKEIFATGVVLGTYLAVMTVVFFYLAADTDFFSNIFKVRSIRDHPDELTAALYLQVSIISQALIFVTRSRSWSFVERPGLMLVTAFFIAQLVATLIAVYANWSFARIQGIGWGWGGVIWIFSIVTYFPLDILKFIIRYALSGKAWDSMIQNKTAFTTKKDYGREEREAQWALAQRTLHGLQTPESAGLFNDKHYRELSEIAEQAKRRAEVARLRELHTLKGHVESVVKLKGLDIETIQQHYTV
ncbi:unnamed protein product [Coffea canephora]|uniref:P-type H(+)-exporting transporter n=1 Tax=Coffea canephora TaxID=49390 RepID=A0A068V332_COFCA|nr:unnamed protein product [Coffea canephora]